MSDTPAPGTGAPSTLVLQDPDVRQAIKSTIDILDLQLAQLNRRPAGDRHVQICMGYLAHAGDALDQLLYAELHA